MYISKQNFTFFYDSGEKIGCKIVMLRTERKKLYIGLAIGTGRYLFLLSVIRILAKYHIGASPTSKSGGGVPFLRYLHRVGVHSCFREARSTLLSFG